MVLIPDLVHIANINSELLREPNLLIPGKKPIGPVKIDWEHPLTSGLVFCDLFRSELVNGLVPTTDANTSTKVLPEHGMSNYFPGDNTDEAVRYDYTKVPTFDNVTITMIMSNDYTSDESLPAWLTLFDGTDDNTRFIRILYRADTKQYRFRLFTSAATNLDILPGSFPANRVIILTFVYDGVNMRIYQDGTDKGNIAKTGSITAANSDWILGSDYVSDADTKAHSVIPLFMIHNRGLTPKEITELNKDPYQILVPA